MQEFVGVRCSWCRPWWASCLGTDAEIAVAARKGSSSRLSSIQSWCSTWLAARNWCNPLRALSSATAIISANWKRSRRETKQLEKWLRFKNWEREAEPGRWKRLRLSGSVSRFRFTETEDKIANRRMQVLSRRRWWREAKRERSHHRRTDTPPKRALVLRTSRYIA